LTENAGHSPAFIYEAEGFVLKRFKEFDFKDFDFKDFDFNRSRIYIIVMDTNTDTNTFDPAPDQPTPRPVLYARFPRSFGLEFILNIFLGPPLVVLWSFLAYYYYLNGTISFPILKVAVYYSAGFVLVLLLYGNNRATRRGSGIILDGERVVEKNSGGVNMLDYSEMRGVSCTKNPLFNKKMVIAHTAGKTVLPLNLSGSYKMVETILEKLTADGRLNENEKKTARAKRRLYVTAMQYNALYKVRERHIQILVAVLVGSALFNGAVAVLYWGRGLATALLWGFASMLFQAFGYFAAERFWAWKLFDRPVPVNAGHGVDTNNNGNSAFKSVNDREGYELFEAVHAAAAVAALLLGMVIGIAIKAVLPPA